MNLKAFLKATIGFVIFLFLISYVRPTWNLILEIQPKLLLMSYIFLMIHIFLRALSLGILTKNINKRILLIGVTSMALNEIGIKGGGDGYKMYALHKEAQITKKRSILYSFIDRAIAFFSLVFSSLLVLSGSYLIFLISCAGFLMALWMFKEGKHYILSFISSCVAWVSESVAVFFILKMFSHTYNFKEVMLLVMFYTIVGYLIFISSFLGIRESIFVIFAKVMHKVEEIYFIASLVLRASYVMAYVSMLILLKTTMEKFKKIKSLSLIYRWVQQFDKEEVRRWIRIL